MRYIELFERAAISKGVSKYESDGELFYITHRVEEPFAVHCNAYVAGKTYKDQNRTKVAVASCTMQDRPHDNTRNNVRVYSDKSFVEPEYRRYGLLSAMYDHLENYGFVVYPANGEIGDKNLQAQSADAKAFWNKRKTATPKKLIPSNDTEMWEVNKKWTDADSFEGMPVIEKIDVRGYQNPVLVLWSKSFSSGTQKVGVTYTTERGYRCVVLLVDKEGTHDDKPWIVSGEDERTHFYNKYIEKKIKASTLQVLNKIGFMCYPNN